MSASGEGRQEEQSNAIKKHIRGSSLLLAGRLVALLLNFGIQVIIVRYLTKSDYGAFVYALSVMTLGSRGIGLGLDKGFGRFVPIYHERGEHQRISGAIVMVLGTILSLGMALIVLVFGLQGVLAGMVVNDPLSLSLLLILICAAPLQALENVFAKMFAIFASPRALFFRRHVLGPGLKLTAVLAVVVFQGNVFFLAIAYLIAGIAGTTISVIVLAHVFHRQGLLQHFKRRQLKMPARTMFRFSLPLLSTDLVYVLRSTLVVVLLGFFHSTTTVAAFRAVLPVARLNVMVYDSFKLLFVPVASRLFARGDRGKISDLYWQNTSWIAVLTFPIFAVSFSLARPTTVLLFGERYADSGVILAVLSFGCFFNAAFGFNALALRVFRKVRTIVKIDMAMVLFALAANVMLIPPFGALGGALATCATLVLQNVVTQVALRRAGIVSPLKWCYLRVYGIIIVAAFGLLFIQAVFSPPIYMGLFLAAIGSLLVLWLSADVLDVKTLFPELSRLRPKSRQLFSLGKS